MSARALQTSLAQRLLKIAERRAEELGRRIEGLARAHAEGLGAIAALDLAVDAERAAALAFGAGGIVDFARYAAAAAERRAALSATAARLSMEITMARDALAEAYAEMKKLEHVAGLAAEQAARTQARYDLAALDEAARRRFTAAS